MHACVKGLLCCRSTNQLNGNFSNPPWCLRCNTTMFSCRKWFSGRQEFSGPTNPNNPADIAPFVGGIHPARHAPAGGRGLGPPGDGGGGLGPHGRVRLRPDAGIVHTHIHFTHAGGASNLARRFISTPLCAGDAVAAMNCGPQPAGAAAATISSSM